MFYLDFGELIGLQDVRIARLLFGVLVSELASITTPSVAGLDQGNLEF